MSEAELHRWLAGARAGEAIRYFRGFLAMDRAAGSRLDEADRTELDRVARAAMALAEVGRVHLVQRRHGADDYDYILVVARGRPASAGSRARAREAAP